MATTKLTKELFANNTYAKLQELTGMTSRELHIEAFRLGLLPEGTKMTVYWKKCAERAAKVQREVVANATKSTKPASKVRKVEAKA